MVLPKSHHITFHSQQLVMFQPPLDFRLRQITIRVQILLRHFLPFEGAFIRAHIRIILPLLIDSLLARVIRIRLILDIATLAFAVLAQEDRFVNLSGLLFLVFLTIFLDFAHHACLVTNVRVAIIDHETLQIGILTILVLLCIILIDSFDCVVVEFVV